MVKIKSITSIGKKQTYDLHTPIYNNFYLGNGILTHNSGKTFTNRAVMERIYSTGAYSVFLIDPKNEYNSSNEPAPAHQPKFYARGEKPKGFPVLSFKPLFFKTFRIAVPEDDTNMATGFNIGDLSFSDINEIFKMEELPPLQKSFVQDIAFALQKRTLVLNNIEELKAIIETSGLNASSKAGLKMKLNAFFSMEFFVEPALNPVDFLNQDKIVCLNLERFDDVDKNGGAPQIALGIWQRMIVNARKENMLKKKRLLISIDESNRFLPKDRETSVKLDVIENVELTRAYGVSYLFWYQTIGSVPIPILENSRYVLIPNNASYDVFKEAYDSTALFKGYSNQLRQHISYIKSRLRKFSSHAWLVMDRESGAEHLVKFYTPLSEHCTKD